MFCGQTGVLNFLNHDRDFIGDKTYVYGTCAGIPDDIFGSVALVSGLADTADIDNILFITSQLNFAFGEIAALQAFPIVGQDFKGMGMTDETESLS